MEAVRQRVVAVLRRQLTWRHVMTVLALGVAAFVGAWLGLVLGGHRTDTVGPLIVTSEVRLSLTGDTDIDVPPLGSISLDTHDGPLALRAQVEALNANVTEQTLSGDVPDADFDQVPDQVRSLLWKVYVQALACAALGAALAVLIVSRRPKWAAIAAGATAGVVVLSGLAGVATWNERALAQPRYSGLLVFVPRVVGDADTIVNNFEAYGQQLASLVQNVASLATAASDLPTFQASPGAIRALYVSDIHLNPNVWPIMRSIVEQYNIDLVIDTGDIADHGTSFENSLLSPISSLGVPYVYIRGNHDSVVTADAIANMDNAVVLDDSIREVAGLTIAGAPDPRFTPDKSTEPTDDAVVRSGEELARVIQSAKEPVNLAMVHDPAAADPLAGLTPLVLAGHLHERADEQLGDGTQLLVQGSTGGAGLRGLESEAPTPLTFTVLYFDRETKLLTARDEFTLGGLGTASAEVERILEDQPAQ
ncbi:MAG: metallophosphoesterase [Actinomycetes bacterium]